MESAVGGQGPYADGAVCDLENEPPWADEPAVAWHARDARNRRNPAIMEMEPAISIQWLYAAMTCAVVRTLFCGRIEFLLPGEPQRLFTGGCAPVAGNRATRAGLDLGAVCGLLAHHKIFSERPCSRRDGQKQKAVRVVGGTRATMLPKRGFLAAFVV